MLTSVQSRCPAGVAPFQQSSCGLPRRNLVLQRPAVCNAQRPQREQAVSALKPFALPLTAAVAAALLLSAGTPDAALAARSGGRVGGSSFRSARPAPAPRGGGGGGQSGPTIRNYNYHSYSPPPVYGGYGPGYGYGGGIQIMPSFGVPLIGGGSFLTIVFGLFALSAILSIARSISSRGKRDDFNDFD
ncbi:hypothetical protein WJX79_010556 [Trebouxia sp. C0005]